MNLKDNMADVQKLASILIEGGFSPSDYAALFEKINGSTTSSSAAAGGGGEVKPKKSVKKTTKAEAEVASVKSSDSPTRVSPKYKMELRKIIAERYGVATKADQDKILDKFTKDWIKSKSENRKDYENKLKYTETVAKEFIEECFPSKKEESEDEASEDEVEVVEKTIVIDGKPTVVYHDAKSNSVYDDKDNLIGKLNAANQIVPL